MDEIVLNQQQLEAKNLIENWYNKKENDKQTFVLAGYAGTGKTFLINYIINNILKLSDYQVAFIAPTGKAASVLLQRGASNASTIHQLIYTRVEKEYKTEVENEVVVSKKFEFIKKPSIPDYKLLVLDETSMVDKKTMIDILSYGIRVICLGDPGQLPPPVGISNGLLDKPDYTLTEIVRQESDNAIVKLATMARNNIPIRSGNYGNVMVMDSRYMTESQILKIMESADQVLCGTNATRRMYNEKIKKHLGLDPNKLNENEKVICLLNNWEIELDGNDGLTFPLVNGMIGTAIRTGLVDSNNISTLKFKADFLDTYSENLIYDNKIFSDGEFQFEFHDKVCEMFDGSYEPKVNIQTLKMNRENIMKYVSQKKNSIATKQINFFEPGYCISVHKSQGAEWDNVVVIDQSRIFSNDASKWLYTAITRAKKKLIIIR